MDFSKVKVVKGPKNTEQVKLTFTKMESDKTSTDVEEIHRAPIHDDFRAALKALAIHFAILADYIPPKQIKNISKYDAELIENFFVSGYSLGGDDDSRGVIITGHKRKTNGKAIIINTPFTRFIESEESQYQFIEHLEERIAEVEREAKLYLEGKRAPEPQQSLDFPEDDNNQDEIIDHREEDDIDDHGDEINTVSPEAEALPAKPKKKRATKKSTKKSSPLKAVK